MHPAEYAKTRHCEDTLWWHQAMHHFMLLLLPPAPAGGAPPRVLDIGCGTGGFLDQLTARGYQATGLDYSSDAIAFCAQRSYHRLVVGTANHLPLASGSFDLVCSMNVLDQQDVDPACMVSEALRVLRPGGVGVFAAAAHAWLLSEHDVAVSSVRRYSLRQFLALFHIAGARVRRGTYLFALLFAPMALWKIMRRPRRGLAAEQAVSDLALPPAWLNQALYRICRLESRLLPLMRLPVGTTVCAVVEKNHAA